MKAFLTPLQGLAEFEQIKEKSKTNKGILQVSGCMESQKSHLMYGLSGIAPYRLILAEDERRAREIYEDYRFYDRKVYSYPAKDLLFFQADIHGNLLIRQRMKVIKALLEEKELTVVTSIDGCMDFLESLEKIKEQLIHYESDSTVDTEQLKNQLVALGYERVGQVEMPGQFSVRGGIVDIYCLTEENPWRIELWGDEIDSIRSFDPESQRSLENLEELTIYPAVEHTGDKDMVSFLDYFPEERTIIFLDEPNRLTEKGGAVEEEYRQSRMHREEKGSRNLPENWLCSFEQAAEGKAILSMTSKKANLEDVFIELTEGESGVERSGDREEQDIPAVADDAGNTQDFRKTEDSGSAEDSGNAENSGNMQEAGNAENSGSDSAESEGTDE